jgi:hypothetical protein
MTQPVWKTPAGSLGTIAEGVFYNLPLVATAVGSVVTYRVIAGQLPAGIEINEDGILTGVANAVSKVEGVATRTAYETTSKFAVRATSGNNLADRTFTLTVNPQNTPSFVTLPGPIGTYIDGDQIFDLQVQTYNPDVYASDKLFLINGTLPPGLSISPSGIISGVIQPNPVTGGIAGFSRDGQGYDQYPYDFSTQSVGQNYQFTLELTNGQASTTRTFSIYVYSRNAMTADNTYITADNTYITADTINQRTPVILTPAGSLGSVRSNNFFAFQFIGEDLDGDQFKFKIKNGDSPPPGLTLDPNSGWLYGLIPSSGISITKYSFDVQVYKTNEPNIISNSYAYNLTITGAVNADTVWLVPTQLGAIDNGTTSTFYVAAKNKSGLPLTYQLLSGSDSRLPQGLRLRPSGNIVGRVSFDTFALDGGTTVFDSTNAVNNTFIPVPTTFDLTYTFTVLATSSNGLVNTTETFTIRVLRTFNDPYDNLYIQAMPSLEDRSLVNGLLQNNNIFPPGLIYRNDDPNFGVSRRVVYEHAYGLTADTLDAYVEAMNLNHYWKNLTLGEIKTARALDDLGNVIYEVVYSEVVDDLVNNQGTSVDKVVDLPYTVDHLGNIIQQVYPNSLVNMRTQIIDQIGLVSKVLPRWMLSKQVDGRILGFVPAWVIAYTIPGQAGQIAYNISTSQFGNRLNLIDFKADRYELDNALTYNWNREDQHWIPSPPTAESFDVECHYEVTSYIGGTGYVVGDRLKVLGTQVGGATPVNDIQIYVNQVSAQGSIKGYFLVSGVAPYNSASSTWADVTTENIVGTGGSSLWNFKSVPGVATIFDGGSLQFSAPTGQFDDGTTDYDRYLLFPKRNIIEDLPHVTATVVYWYNTYGDFVTWVNDSNVPVNWVRENL